MKFGLLSRQSGLSLIELMLAITLGLMILVTLGYVLQGSRATYLTQDASARVQDTGRFAMEYIGRQIRAAGRADITPMSSDGRIALDSSTVPITGTATSLTVQYQASQMQGEVIQDCNGAGPNNVGTLPVIGGTALSYGVVNNLIDKSGTDLECTGSIINPSSNTQGTTNKQPFADNVEDLQFLYGIDTNGDQAVDSWKSDPTGNESQIVAVQVCILVRSPNLGAINTPQAVANCSGGQSASDTHLRRRFTSVFTLRNRLTVIPQ